MIIFCNSNPNATFPKRPTPHLRQIQRRPPPLPRLNRPPQIHQTPPIPQLLQPLNSLLGTKSRAHQPSNLIPNHLASTKRNSRLSSRPPRAAPNALQLFDSRPAVDSDFPFGPRVTGGAETHERVVGGSTGCAGGGNRGGAGVAAAGRRAGFLGVDMVVGVGVGVGIAINGRVGGEEIVGWGS
jgi:hypothetical protein